MKKIIAVMFVLLAAAGCSDVDTQPGEAPEGENPVYTTFDVKLSNGRTIECISSDSYYGYGILDCNWESQ